MVGVGEKGRREDRRGERLGMLFVGIDDSVLRGLGRPSFLQVWMLDRGERLGPSCNMLHRGSRGLLRCWLLLSSGVRISRFLRWEVRVRFLMRLLDGLSILLPRVTGPISYMLRCPLSSHQRF